MNPRPLPWWAIWLTPVLAGYAGIVLLGAGEHLDGLSWALLTLGAVSSLVPWLLGREADRAVSQTSGQGLVAALACLIALHAISVAAPARSLVLEVLQAILPGGIGAITVWLALRAPEAPRALTRVTGIAVLVTLLAVVAGVLGALVCLAPFELGGEDVVLPGSLLALGPGVLLGALLVAAVFRGVRGRLGAGPEELAQSSLAILGIVVGLLVVTTVGVLTRFALDDLSIERDLFRASWLVCHVGLLAGHTALVRGVRPARAAQVVRLALSYLITYGIALTLLALARHELAELRAFEGALLLAVVLPLLLLLFRVMSEAVYYVLAPDRGRLLRAIELAKVGLPRARSLEELGQTVLAPLRLASRQAEARPVLLVVTPPCEVTVDAASVPHVHTTEASPALLGRLRERPGAVLLRGPLEAAVVRQPELRPLLEVLERHDALAVVALVTLGELDGALVVPRGLRRAAVTLEEMAELNALGAALSGVVASLAAERRAHDRASAALLGVSKLDDRIEALEEENAALRADAAALKSGASADRFSRPLIAYGPMMRAFVERAESVAALDAPLLLRAEPGTALEPMGQLLHAASPRRDGPLVIADALTIQAERAMASLFGSEGEHPHPGWLRLAQGGTLLLLDVPALPLGAQTALEEAIASRQIRAEGSLSAVPLDARVVLTSRVDIGPLAAQGVFDAELAKRVEALTLAVPSLTARHEDIRSLVLMAIDRGCRALGKATVGIEEAAMRALLVHPFSAGTRELEDLVERAVARAAGTRVTLADLALGGAEPTSPTSEEEDGWVGSYTQLETRILEKALERAGGNKSEAARALGLKRTTFLDKLRRAGLERPTQPPPSQGPEA